MPKFKANNPYTYETAIETRLVGSILRVDIWERVFTTNENVKGPKIFLSCWGDLFSWLRLLGYFCQDKLTIDPGRILQKKILASNFLFMAFSSAFALAFFL